jgi:hypothetical protein
VSSSENLVIYPAPSLVAILLNRENAKGSPLIEEEVLEIRDACPSIALPVDVALKMDESRGYKDIDPDRCWEEWLVVREHLVD